jgi:hypothetical protein
MKPRHLAFQNPNEVIKEAERLLHGPYQKAGTWDLAQVCNHLAEALDRSMTTGVRPMVPLPVRWWLRWRYLDKILASGRIRSGVRAPAEVATPTSEDPAAAVQRLRGAVARFQFYQGQFTPHPYFGYLPPEKARRFHLIHCAHHLGHLIPA